MDLTTGPSLPLGVLSEHPGVLETITYQLNGLVVVFLALCFIWAVMEVVGLFFRRKAAAEEAVVKAAKLAAEEAAALALTNAPAEPSLPPELIAVIAAAVKVTLRHKRYKVHAIVPAASDWAREGRRQIFSSHSIR